MHISDLEFTILCRLVVGTDVSGDHTGSIDNSTLKLGSVCSSQTLTPTPILNTAIHLCKALQPLLRPDLPQTAPPFFCTPARFLQCRIPIICHASLWTTPSYPVLRVGANKSLAGPTSRCRRTESTVSLERGVCSCAELHVFSCYRG